MPSKPYAVTVRGKKRWRIHICVAGKRESKTLDTKNGVLTWAVEREALLRGQSTIIHGKNMGDAFERFSTEVAPERKGWRTEQKRLKRLQSDPLALVPVFDLTMQHAKDFMAREKLRGLKPNSVIRIMNLIKVVVRYCVEWQWIPEYPWTGLKMPKAGKARTRIPTQSEIKLITKTAELTNPCTSKTHLAVTAWLLALETAMRQGEICTLAPEDINFRTRTAHLSETKNGDARVVPLSSKAVELLKTVEPNSKTRYFGITSDVCSVLFRRVMKKAGIEGLTFHDSRAYAVGRLSKKVDIYTLSRITGHRDLNMLMTYYREDMSDIAKKLD